MFTVYVIYNSLASKTYTGQTEVIQRRIDEHNNHTYKGFMSRYHGEWVLIYTESVASRTDALIREKQLKSGNGRAFTKTLIPG